MVRGCTWYFRLLLKGSIAGAIVGARGLSERSDLRGRWQALGLRSKRAVPMSILIPPAPGAGTSEDSDEVRAARLETLIAQMVAQQASGQIGYWVTFKDERWVSHYALTTDPTYADLSPENAASRTGAVAAFSRAIERYRATLTAFRPAP
jgi:hypothetical protein